MPPDGTLRPSRLNPQHRAVPPGRGPGRRPGRIEDDPKDRPYTLPHQLRQNLLVLFIIVGLHVDVMQVHAAFFLCLKALNTLFN